MGTINVEMCDGIAVLELNNGITNAISPGLAADLAQALKDAELSARGVVLCGNEKFFSMGFNLPELIKNQMLMRHGNSNTRIFNTESYFPFPFST